LISAKHSLLSIVRSSTSAGSVLSEDGSGGGDTR
jgi:hypothetical protein